MTTSTHNNLIRNLALFITNKRANEKGSNLRDLCMKLAEIAEITVSSLIIDCNLDKEAKMGVIDDASPLAKNFASLRQASH